MPSDLFINSLAPWQWLVLGAVPPLIVALYFLKLRRRPIEVPSTYLWHRTIEDLHVNSLWQRLRRSLLLLLQLLVVALVAMALLRPGWRGVQLSGDRFIFLVDTSASMSAADVKPTRLGEAKRRVDEMIRSMKSGDKAMIIAFSDKARTVQGFTDNRRLLRRKLARIAPTHRTSDLKEALRLAAGLANPGRTGQRDTSDVAFAEAQPATLYIFSDGRFGPVTDFAFGNLTPKYEVIGSDRAENVGIVALSTQRNPERPERLQAFGRLENYGDDRVTVELTLRLDGALRDAAELTIPGRSAEPPHEPGTAGVEFQVDDLESGTLQLRIERPDDFPEDNVAWTVVNLPRRARVLLVTPQNDALERALGTEEAGKIAEVSIATPELLDTKQYARQADSGDYDLIIYDQCAPKRMPQANTLFVGRLPPAPAEPAAGAESADGVKNARLPGQWLAGEKRGVPQVIDTDRAHPLMQFIELGNVRIAEAMGLRPPPGSTGLIYSDIPTSDSDSAPIYAVAPRGGFEDAVLGFEIVGYDREKGQWYANTDWPIRRSFALFVMNAVEYLGGAGASLSTGTVQPGKTMTLRTDAPVQEIHVEPPRPGKPQVVRRAGQSAFPFSGTDEPGIYKVREGNSRKIAQRFAVNLFDAAESDIRPRKTLPVGAETVRGATAWEPMRRELWKYVLLAGLGVLLLEWYIFNRRVYL